MAFLVSRWSLNNSSTYTDMTGMTGLLLSISQTGFLADFVQIQAWEPVRTRGRRFLWRLHFPCRLFGSTHEKWLVLDIIIILDTIWQFELVQHEHQSVGARCAFQSAVCKVTYVLCDEMCTNNTTCFLAHGSVCDLADNSNNGIPYPSMHAKKM